MESSSNDYYEDSIFELIEDDSDRRTDGSILTPYLYFLHCVFVPIVLIFYIWVLFVFIYWRKHFPNQFYKLALCLGLCNLHNQIWLCYVFAYTYKKSSPFGIDEWDNIFAATSWVMWFANLYFQVVIATNRLIAIGCYQSYFLLFTSKATMLCCFVCFALSTIQIAPLFGSHPVAFNLSEGIDRFLDSEDQFAVVWEWLEALLISVLLFYIIFSYLITFGCVRSKLKSIANRMSIMNEINLALASFIIVVILILYSVSDFLHLSFLYVRTLECLYHGIPPFVYLIFDRKLRRHMIWCQRIRRKLYFNRNGVFETLTVSGRQMSGKVNRKYYRMNDMTNCVDQSGELVSGRL